jgi:hypothetical protein
LPKEFAAGWLMPALALLVGIAGMTVAWVAVAVLSGQPCSWLALVAALDMALMLRLTRAPAGTTRMLVALLATALAVVATQWLIIATQLGAVMGLPPLASALRLGPALAWHLASLSLDRLDWILLVSALPLAAILVQVPRVRER